MDEPLGTLDFAIRICVTLIIVNIIVWVLRYVLTRGVPVPPKGSAAPSARAQASPGTKGLARSKCQQAERARNKRSRAARKRSSRAKRR